MDHDEKPKKPLTTLFRNNPETPEGKYLVIRRDGTVVEWPSFVLGARDEDAETCLQVYGLLKLMTPDQKGVFLDELADRCNAARSDPHAQNISFYDSVMDFAEEWHLYRMDHGDGDPLMGAHRKDDPETIAKMKKGRSA